MTLFTNAKTLFTTLSILIFLALLTSCNSSISIPTETLVPTISLTATLTLTPEPTSTLTPMPSPTFTPIPTINPHWVSFDSEWLKLSYPKDWIIEKSDGELVCPPTSDDCVIRWSHPSANTVEINFSRSLIAGKSLDVIQADERDWNNTKLGAIIVGAPDLLKSISVDEIKVDSIKAVKRLYEYPLVDMVTNKVTGTQYNYHVMIVDGKYIYSFQIQATSADEFTKYTEVADKILETISFPR